ncbi:hypothetical protein HOLleu_43463 [Holothuria leucospilota]|uniref:Uncharacterized protein n=1 Tax=Holothuria leucospilota TaxID=206669 RepID=A0A9Q1BB24_HOLLE|nr:hypothetical protein HOLleu_43463 [Holothuria leucospilota]
MCPPKNVGALPGLAFLDTARCITPYCPELSYGLQEKWLTKGAQYKEDHKVTFPPFAFFSKLVRQQAKIRSEPSFVVSSTTASRKPARPVRVNTHLTETTDTPIAKKQCPIHKPHPLHKCRAFLSKPGHDRKAYLRDNKVCFRCLSTSEHMAKDCKEPVKCIECDSKRHWAALHTNPAPAKEAPAIIHDGGEETNSITSKCTGICGKNSGEHPCSKICLIVIYPDKEVRKAIKAYVVLEEQSNRSLARSHLLDVFGINCRNILHHENMLRQKEHGR